MLGFCCEELLKTLKKKIRVPTDSCAVHVEESAIVCSCYRGVDYTGIDGVGEG